MLGMRLVVFVPCYRTMNSYLVLTCPALSMLASKRYDPGTNSGSSRYNAYAT